VQLIHGLEGSPRGAKAQYLAQRFELLCPEMNTGDFEAALATQAAALVEFRPDVVVGSSFGGAVALALVQRGPWAGPTLLLAPALGHFGVALSVPPGAPVTVVHGTRDAICPVEDSRRLAAAGGVRLVELDDEHRLSTLLGDERLADWVRELAAGEAAAPGSPEMS
jgi:pimeloyl-ACP methyl ester carboxylesterase